jgi:DNA-binding MarR family transcriptional regulator
MQKNKLNDADYFEIWMLIGNSRDMISRLREKELLENCGLTIRESVVLIYLNVIAAEGRAATPSELARRALRNPNTMLYLLDRMEKRGLIKQAKDTHRKNVTVVTLTEKGKEAYTCSRHNIGSIRAIMESIPVKNLLKLKSILEEVRRKTLEMSGKYEPQYEISFVKDILYPSDINVSEK